ncbi:MAG: AmmeMemoRadiSam system protein B [Clostridiales bacterium]|nr:AmmeMemoRadiSam system protein B [Clostridiales bacterium]
MNRFVIWLTAAFFLFASFAEGQGLRKAVWAGAFYDEDPDVLSAQIDDFLKNVRALPPLAGEPQALVCPHAGYIYSGQTAAYAYRLVQEKSYETVVVIGPSHRHGFDGCSIYAKGGFETPLGVVEVDSDLAERIAKKSGFSYIAAAHKEEHSIEVQVPFIQKVLPGAKIVPIVMGYPTRKTISSLAEGLAEVVEAKKTLIIASTDLSHDLSKEEAKATDSQTISLIQKLETATLINKLSRGENFMCGGGPVVSTLLALKKRGKPSVEVLHYSDSSRFGGRIVGYLAAAVILKDNQAPEFSLSREEKKELLRLARQAIKEFVEKNRILEYTTDNPNLVIDRGAFVTLKNKGELRGCIGFIEPVLPLSETVIRAAIYAATQDTRFNPVTEEELKDLEVEISVLAPLQKIEDPRSVEVGKHGLVISMGNKKGLLLPQVAVENRWGAETFLRQACLKAGLSSDAWKKGAEIFVFEAIVFE